MREGTYKAYHIFWASFAVMFVALLAFFHLSITEQETKDGYEIITEYERLTYIDRATPIGYRYSYNFTLDGVEEAYCHLMTYSVHQNVRIFVGDVCVYRMSADEIDFSGTSPGCVWNQVSLSEEDNGKRVRVEFTPVYESSKDIVPTIYFGSKADIMRDVLMKDLPVVIASLVTIAIGVIYIAFILCSYKKSDVERGLLMLGYFAVQAGLWKLTDTQLVPLLLPGYPVLSQIPFLALMLMCVSFSLFVKEMYSTREHIIWYVPCFFGFGNMVLSFMLQYLGILEMREMLPVTHINMILVIAITCVMTVYEVRTVGWNPKLKRNIWCFGICFIGTGCDLLFYYLLHGQNSNLFGMLGFMIYIFFMGFGSIQEIKNLMDIGIKAQQYEKMAYHDQLTGLFNRTAFAEHTGSMEFVAEKCIIIVMDLNNLKTCNDKLGHDKGDIYIKECARMVQETFEDIGHCYRMGGDEFNVLLQNGDLHLCKQRLQALKERVAKCDKIDGFKMGIACGYKMYDRLLDYDIHETARRADKVMYQEKFAMKEL